MQTNEVDKADAFVMTDPDVMGGRRCSLERECRSVLCLALWQQVYRWTASWRPIHS